MLVFIAALCIFLSVLSAIYAVRATNDEKYKHNFTVLAFLSAVFAVGAYIFTLGLF